MDANDLAIFGQPPREVTPTLRNALLLGAGYVSWLGPLFCIIGLLPTTIIAFIFTLDDAIPREWEPAGEATVVAVKETSVNANNRRVYAYHFQGAIEGTSYGFNGAYKPNDTAPLEHSRNRWGNDKYRIANLHFTTIGPVCPIFFFLFFGIYGGLFAIAGLTITIYAFCSGQRIVRLLRDGDTTLARQDGVRKTLMHVNNRSVLKATLRYKVDGEEYTTYASSLDAERLNAETHVVFYDRDAPSCAVAWSGLPRITIEADEWCDGTVRLTTTWWRAAMPTLVLLAMAGVLVAFAVALIRAV